MNAVITVPRDERLTDLFSPEDLEISRASYEIAHDEEHTTFSVTAEDAVGLRIALSAITKTLSMWEAADV